MPAPVRPWTRLPACRQAQYNLHRILFITHFFVCGLLGCRCTAAIIPPRRALAASAIFRRGFLFPRGARAVENGEIAIGEASSKPSSRSRNPDPWHHYQRRGAGGLCSLASAPSAALRALRSLASCCL